MKRILFVLGALATGTLVFAAEEGWSSWDLDRDDQLDLCEVRTGMLRFGPFADLQGRLTEDQFSRRLGNTGYFGMYDADGSGWLAKEELDRFGGNFDAWDTDDDDRLGQDELYVGLYMLWGGTDRGLTIDELSQGLFETWDVNRDDVVTEREFEPGWRALSEEKPGTGT